MPEAVRAVPDKFEFKDNWYPLLSYVNAPFDAIDTDQEDAGKKDVV